MRHSRFVIAAAIGLAAIATPAQSAIISNTYSFTATAPTGSGLSDPVIGSFYITFDNVTDITNQTSGIIVNQLNFTVNSAVGFTYSQ